VLSVCQPVFSQSEGLEGEASETHYYYPVTDATQTTMVENVQAPETLLTQSTSTGQLKLCHSNMSQLAPCPILQCWHIYQCKQDSTFPVIPNQETSDLQKPKGWAKGKVENLGQLR
jgi:hypothetical protein